jgi:type IV pilus assembly protein PilP
MAPAAMQGDAADGGTTTADYQYDPTNKRDPFRSFVKTLADPNGDFETPLERFDLNQLTVTAIVWGVDPPRALIRDPAGKGYIVVEGTTVGKNKGRIIAIEDNLVRVKETYVDALGRAATKSVEMRLRETQGG